MLELKENTNLLFTQLTDLCGIDYSTYGQSEWQTYESTSKGYNRGIDPKSHGRIQFDEQSIHNTDNKLCVVYHLLSIEFNQRIRIKVMLSDNFFIDSITGIWDSANWYEREAFD